MTTTTVTEAELSAELRAQLEQIEAIKRDARELLDGLDDRRLNWRPEPSRWSIAQCLHHIVLSGAGYLPRLGELIETSRERTQQRRPPFRAGIISSWFIRSMEPPPRFKAKTFRAMEPPPAPEHAEEVLRAFLAFHDELAMRVRAMHDVDANGARMHSPFFRPLRFTLGQVVALLITHARRHLWQARQVRQHPGFP
jgi:DinB superfamily